jgi:DNA-binding response OmpR family regulator
MKSETVERRLSYLLDQIEQCCVTARTCAGEARELLTQAAHTKDAAALSQRRSEFRPIADPLTMRIEWRGKTCTLGHTTLFKLFKRLVRHPNAYVSYAQLRDEVWSGVKADETIRSAVRHLKRRLKDAGMSDLAASIKGENHHYALVLDPPY